MKKNLLLLTWHGGTGGISKMVYEIAKHLKNSTNFNVSVAYAKEGGIFCEDLKKLNIPVHIFNMKNGFDLISAVKLIFFLLKTKPDIVHLHYTTPLLRISTFLACKKLIITEHCGIQEYKKKKLWPIYCAVARMTNKFIGKINTTVSHCNKEDLYKYNYFSNKIKEVIVIPNGIDCSLFSSEKTSHHLTPSELLEKSMDDKFVGTIRGLTKRHRIDHFILMAHEILQNRNDVKFIIVGEGPELENLKNLSKKLHANNSVIFLGARPTYEIPSIISKFDIFVLSSEYEAFGISAIEAMAMEKPVVAYAAGGLQEVITDGKDGILIYEQNPIKLAQAVNQLLDDVSLRKKLGKNGREKVKKIFDIKQVVNRYIELYFKL